MKRSTLILALAASACITSTLAQTSSPPRNDLQGELVRRRWGKAAAPTSMQRN
jgi:hypothetical protein